MSCIWEGLIKALRLKKIKTIDKQNVLITPNILLNILQKENRDTPDMRWNGQILNEQLQNDNMQHISSLDHDTKNGYLCSTCDPLLLLIGQIYNVSIEHKYINTIIFYENITSNKKICVKSNKSHFWVTKKI